MVLAATVPDVRRWLLWPLLLLWASGFLAAGFFWPWGRLGQWARAGLPRRERAATLARERGLTLGANALIVAAAALAVLALL